MTYGNFCPEKSRKSHDISMEGNCEKLACPIFMAGLMLFKPHSMLSFDSSGRGTKAHIKTKRVSDLPAEYLC